MLSVCIAIRKFGGIQLSSNHKPSQNTTGSKQGKRINPGIFVVITIAIIIAGYLGVTNLTDPVNIVDPPASFTLADGEAAVHFIDVGQGESVFIQTTQGSVLIDGGDNNMGSRVVEYIQDTGVSEITYMVATHPHSDHIGGLISVLGEFPVGTLIMPHITHNSRTFERFLEAIDINDVPLKEPVVGSSFQVGEAVFTIIGPNSVTYPNLNNHSVSLRMVLGNVSFIFTGDAERRAELEMIQHNISSDVLYVGHHGSNTSTVQEFLDAISPSIAVISVGRNNYGHPSDEVLDRLHDADVRVYRTDHHGNIVIVTDGANLSIRSQFDGVHN
jgi:competence protein ComEC